MDVPVLPAADILILSVPFLLILGMGIFGLDQRLASPRRLSPTRPSFCEVDANGTPFLSDPDGRLCPAPAIKNSNQAPIVDRPCPPPPSVVAAAARQPPTSIARFYVIQEE